MKFLLKTFLITFTFSQIAMAGRMFDPEVGRFISRDPLGYVDGMSLYNGYFAERFNVDPSGHSISWTREKSTKYWSDKKFDKNDFVIKSCRKNNSANQKR